jgi:phage terminase small subunit
MTEETTEPQLPKLKRRHKRLADLWLMGWKGSEAAAQIGYTGTRGNQVAYLILRRPEVKAYIKQRREDEEDAYQVNKGSVVRRLYLAASLETSMKDCLRNGVTIHPDELPREVAALITRFEVEEMWEGVGENRKLLGLRYKYWLQDSTRSAEVLSRVMGWNKDKLEVDNSKAPTPVINIMAYDDSDESERAARAAVQSK